MVVNRVVAVAELDVIRYMSRVAESSHVTAACHELMLDLASLFRPSRGLQHLD